MEWFTWSIDMHHVIDSSLLAAAVTMKIYSLVRDSP